MGHEGVSDPFAGAVAALAAARDAWVAAGCTFDGMAPGVLVSVNERLGRARRFLDAATAGAVAEVARQSRVELGRDGLARRQGYRTPVQMVAATTGVTAGDAARLLQVGQAVAPRVTLTGDVMPAKHPHVAAAVSAGTLGSWAAGQIVRLLDRIAPRCAPADADRMERLLVARAPGLTCDQVSKLLVRAEATLDPDGLEPKEDELRTGRSLRIRQDRTGAIILTATLDPESGAYVKTCLEGLVTASYRRGQTGQSAHGEEDPHDPADVDASVDVDVDADTPCAAGPLDGTGQRPLSGPVAPDDRSSPQRYADALTDVCRHALGCDAVPFTRATTTVVVRLTLHDLQEGTGQATIDGIDQPVSITTARRMAATAGVIPCVLGSDSEILDWGRAKRAFTPAQRLALAERDGGCAFCGLPPGYCEAHHIRWWERDRGPTDLANGILLCTRCHHRIHDDEWDIHIHGTGVNARTWFTPPAWLDPTRTPRPGGPHRYDLAA